jgi:hypothetical protein
MNRNRFWIIRRHSGLIQQITFLFYEAAFGLWLTSSAILLQSGGIDGLTACWNGMVDEIDDPHHWLLESSGLSELGSSVSNSRESLHNRKATDHEKTKSNGLRSTRTQDIWRKTPPAFLGCIKMRERLNPCCSYLLLQHMRCITSLAVRLGTRSHWQFRINVAVTSVSASNESMVYHRIACTHYTPSIVSVLGHVDVFW